MWESDKDPLLGVDKGPLVPYYRKTKIWLYVTNFEGIGQFCSIHTVLPLTNQLMELPSPQTWPIFSKLQQNQCF